jgi:hypothetical protein
VLFHGNRRLPCLAGLQHNEGIRSELQQLCSQLGSTLGRWRDGAASLPPSQHCEHSPAMVRSVADPGQSSGRVHLLSLFATRVPHKSSANVFQACSECSARRVRQQRMQPKLFTTHLHRVLKGLAATFASAPCASCSAHTMTYRGGHHLLVSLLSKALVSASVQVPVDARPCKSAVNHAESVGSGQHVIATLQLVRRCCMMSQQ